jgi:uncharacterized protein (TIGR03437 family)
MHIKSLLLAGARLRGGFPATVAVSTYLKGGFRWWWRYRRYASVLVVLLAAHRGFGQQPVITAIQNAASAVPVTSPVGLAPQMLVAIKGQSLSTSAPATASYPWPQQLGGSTVTFNGIAAVLSYVSSTQINAVVPSALQNSPTASVMVTAAAGSSTPVVVPITDDSLGIFTQDMSGCGQAAAFNVHADGSTTMNTPQNSLDPLSDWGLTLFFTGFGAVPDRADGVPWQYNSQDNRAGYGTEAQFGIPSFGGYYQFQIPGLSYSNRLLTTYFGPAPLMGGVDQLNAALPTSPLDRSATPQGCRVPLYLATQDSASQIVNVSIHSGGGACVDSAVNSLGIVTRGQNVVSDASGTSTSSSVTAQFLQGNQLNFTTGFLAGFGEDVVPPQPAVCAASYPTTLSAGTMTISGGGGPVSVQPQTQDGLWPTRRPCQWLPAECLRFPQAGQARASGRFLQPPISRRLSSLRPTSNQGQRSAYRLH